MKAHRGQRETRFHCSVSSQPAESCHRGRQTHTCARAVETPLHFYHRDYAKLHLRNLIREQTVIIHTLERWCNISAVYNVNWWGPYSTNETPKTLNEHLIGVRLSWFNRSLSYRWLCQIGTPVDSFSSLKTLKLIFTQVGERPAGWESWILQSFYKWIHRNSKHLRPDFKFITCLMWKWSNNSFCSLNVCMRVNFVRVQKKHEISTHEHEVRQPDADTGIHRRPPYKSSSFLNTWFLVNLIPVHLHPPPLSSFIPSCTDAAGWLSPPKEEEVTVRSENFWDALGVLDVAAERSHFLPNSEPA